MNYILYTHENMHLKIMNLKQRNEIVYAIIECVFS